jgi:signal transduction histidine kinase
VLAAGSGVLIALDTAAAVRADGGAPRATAWLTAADVTVGLVFPLAAVWAVGPVAQRWLMAAVGAGWLAGTWLPAARSLHQGLLVVALAAFPSGRLRGIRGWVPAALAVPVALGVVPQAAAGVILGAVAALAVLDRRRGTTGRWYPASAGAATGLVLVVAATWALRDPGSFDPAVVLFGWELVLFGVAGAFPVASRLVRRERAHLADEVIEAAAPAGLDGLADVLGQMLGDPGLRIHRWPADDGLGLRDVSERRRLLVSDAARPLAVVEHQASALDDAATAEAVTRAVRLAGTNLLLREEQRDRLADLEASRVRLLAVTDRVRQQAATDLNDEVRGPLAQVRRRIAETRLVIAAQDGGSPDDGVRALDVVLHELTAVDREIAALIAGVPPANLGGGRLGVALTALTRDSGIPVTIIADDDAAADVTAETALFYVCSEALANAVKHSRASQVSIEVRRRGARVEARVSDDGRGGADPAGSGLRGLADRVAAHSGRLWVDSSPGAGTVVSVALPDLGPGSRLPGR